MSSLLRQRAKLSVSALALLAAPLAFGGNALAQSVPADGTPAAKPDDTAEIVVTAQKRTERLQDIPVAAAVLSSGSIAQNHVSDLSDINRIVPSVEIKGTFNGRVPYGIRGISTNANEGAIGLTSGVSIQVDGVPVPADSFAANTVTDVQQLEVLKGPQATLGGRTASAGVINFVTYAPSEVNKFGFNAMLTNDGEHHMDVHGSGQILPGLTGSISAYYQHTPYPVYNATLKEHSNADSKGGRIKLKWQATDALDIGVMAHYALSTSSGENFVPVYFTPGAYFFAAPAGLTQSVMFPGYNIQYGNTTYASHTVMGSRYEDKDGSLVINYHLGNGSVLTSTTSLFRENQWQTQDVFEGNVSAATVFQNFLYNVGAIPAALNQPFDNLQTAYGYVHQTTEEVKLASDAARPVSYIAGFFYSDMTVNQNEFRNWTLNPLAKDNISSTTNYAIYGRATAKLGDKFIVVGGLRYNWDKIGWNITQFFDPANGIYGDGGYGQGGYTWNLKDSSSALVGDAAIQFKPSRDVMVYGSYTRGYKPRAFNTVHDFATTQAAPGAADLPFTQATKRETIDSFELGLKSSLLDRHLTFNLAAYYTKYTNYQAQLFDNSQVIAVLVLANADARTEGVEGDLTYVRGNTRFNLSGAYTDAKFISFPGAVCYPSQTAAQGCNVSANTQDLTGKPLPSSPKFKLTGSLQQTVPTDKFNILLGTNVSYRTGTNMQADQNPYTRQPGFALVDLSLGFQNKAQTASLTFFVNNLTNHMYYTNLEDFFASATSANYVIGQPARDSHRYFGGRLSVNF
ncbi:TonB-dependent receptor [Novosphingobium terrae]|uniref:TonB-dependent receptor n=1 Tax=Novosphingobium terrae TaxID=2726189 RepID=UPI00197CDA97|nr:TonB-dependent receptor [Novosphingobium terrae]